MPFTQPYAQERTSPIPPPFLPHEKKTPCLRQGAGSRHIIGHYSVTARQRQGLKGATVHRQKRHF